MDRARVLKRIQERNFSAHHMLIRAAEICLERGQKTERGAFYEELGAMTFSALGIEAICNSIGDRVFRDWSDFESSSPTAKLRILTKRLGIDYSKEKEPWSSARQLVQFRNLVAHAKPQLLIEEKLITREEHEKRRFDMPQSKLEKLITPGNADRAVKTVQAISDLLIGKLEPEEALGLAADAWSGSTSLHEPPPERRSGPADRRSDGSSG
jgi:hypothetical protein